MKVEKWNIKLKRYVKCWVKLDKILVRGYGVYYYGVYFINFIFKICFVYKCYFNWGL